MSNSNWLQRDPIDPFLELQDKVQELERKIEKLITAKSNVELTTQEEYCSMITKEVKNVDKT